MYDPRRIARNTGLLYLRLILLTVADMAAVRIALSTLGLSGYELFAAVAGVVSTLRFLNGKLEETTQRFLSLEIGRSGDVMGCFRSAVILSAGLGFLVVLLGESAARWFVGTRLAFPADARPMALQVFHVGIAVVVLRTVRIPFTSLVVAGERMGFLAWMAGLEAVLLIGAAWTAGLFPGRAPFAYSCSLFGLDAVLFVAYAVRSWAVLKGVSFCGPVAALRAQCDFLSWSSLSSCAHALKYQGVCLLLTQFAGTAFAASWRISMNLGFNLYGVIGGFQQAYAPQFVKIWGAGDRTLFRRILHMSLVWSFSLMAVFALPGIVFADQLVSVWLGEGAPPQIAAFIQCVLAHFLVDSLAAPLHSAIAATGHIARYQTYVSMLMGAGFLLAACALVAGGPAWSAMAAVALSNALAVAYRVAYVRRLLLNARMVMPVRCTNIRLGNASEA